MTRNSEYNLMLWGEKIKHTRKCETHATDTCGEFESLRNI